ncbi:hypothetical protein [Chroococcidiopsis sp.]|uniref:hypothetical protein n=1 Tax=Chroococcidiopsis sp. TaxID=3088168 RepID=UPI003F2DD08C
MNTVTRIYTLVDPTDGLVFYVGRTTLQLSQRLCSHIRDGQKRRTAKGLKIFEILAKGLKPEIVLIATHENISATDGRTIEGAWIDFYSISHKLTNTGSTCGGHSNNAKIAWTDEVVDLLGKLPDEILAKQLGCDRKTVEFQRRKRSIKPCGYINKPIPPNMGGWNKIKLPEKVIELLGKEPDWLLGKKFGYCKTVIARARKELGVASYAASTGNDGQFKKGEPHRRWKR